jgi:hypothetical protein
MTVDLSGGIATVAFILSCYATWKTVQFNKKQEALIDSQKRLNDLLLEKEAMERAQTAWAILGANFFKVSANNYRLRVFNQGPSVARNVSVSFPQGNEVVDEREVGTKFPMEILDRHQSVDLTASVHLNTVPKMLVRLSWSDGDGVEQTKDVHLTL